MSKVRLIREGYKLQSCKNYDYDPQTLNGECFEHCLNIKLFGDPADQFVSPDETTLIMFLCRAKVIVQDKTTASEPESNTQACTFYNP